MADFSSFKITNGGIALETAAQVSGNLKFTKFVVGDGTYTGSVKTLTALVNPIMELPIVRLRSQTDTNTKFIIGFDISSSEVTTGFYLREIGIYAENPEGGNDILVFYGNSGNTADYIEPRTSATMTEKMIDIEVYINDIANITAEIDSSLVYATQEDLDTLAANVDTKAPINHSSTATTYGVGTSTNYGHNKIINNLTSSSYTDGEALSAYQGYVLNNKFASYLPLTGGTVIGLITANGGLKGALTGNVTGNCTGSSGSCTGNAATATKLANTRTINGTNFDGTAGITTAKWGTARTLALSGAISGSASVDGSGNVTITTSISTGTAAPTSSTSGSVYIQYFT